MFYGTYEHSLDRKGRVIIPAKFREVLKENYVEKFFITAGFEKSLVVFTEEEWRLHEQKIKALPFTGSTARKFQRLFFSMATDVVCDRQGRILLPGPLKKFAAIEKEVVVIGISNRFEIWSRSGWKEFYQNEKDSYEEIAEKLIQE